MAAAGPGARADTGLRRRIGVCWAGTRGPAMQLPRNAILLRIFIGENDRHDGRPLYEAIVLKAREAGLGGATVLRGPMGFGHSSRLHTAKILRLSEDLPFVIEIVDSAAKIATLVPHLKQMVKGGMVTIEDVGVVVYSPDERAS